jgi:hypothetical protein
LVPTISWRHVALGALFALAIAELTGLGAISLGALAAGGFLAGRLAGHHGLLQGAMTGTSFIVAIALLDTLAALPLLTGDTVTLVALDALHLGAGAGGGWLATRS